MNPLFNRQFKKYRLNHWHGLTQQRLSGLVVALAVGLPFALSPLNVTAQEPASNQQNNPATNTPTSTRRYFTAAPRLVRSAATFPTVYTPSNYFFTVEVPANAGNTLQAIRIVQAESPERVAFDLGRSYAFIGTGFEGSPAVGLANVGGAAPERPGEVTIAFDPPVQPGQMVTVALSVDRNPATSGVYLFGITAYPTGGSAEQGLPLGYGRITIYSSRD